MKNHPLRRNTGFTLVELLVVITIIAILAGAGFAVGLSSIQKAKKTTALATCIAIEAAVNNFYTEYGAMPSTAAADAPPLDTKANLDFLKALLGTETIATPLNSRGIKFLSIKDGKSKGASGGFNGAVYDSTGANLVGIFDPWGGTYSVMLDNDYDESVTPTPKAGGGVKLNGRRAAAWSNGADGVTATGKIADDVKNW